MTRFEYGMNREVILLDSYSCFNKLRVPYRLEQGSNVVYVALGTPEGNWVEILPCPKLSE